MLPMHIIDHLKKLEQEKESRVESCVELPLTELLPEEESGASSDIRPRENTVVVMLDFTI